MAWIESHAGLTQHPKTVKAAQLLGVPRVHVVGHLHALWHWAISYAEFGDLSDFDRVDIALAAEWDGDPDAFVQALIDCGPGRQAGFLECDGEYGPPDDPRIGELVLHDWWDYAGKLVHRRWLDRERKRRAREQQSAGPAPPDSEVSDARPEDIQRTSSGHPADVPRARTHPPDPPDQPGEDDADASPPAPDPDPSSNGHEPDPVDAAFESFWQRYPRHHVSGKPGGGGSRKKALQRWRRMTHADRDAALAAVDHYRAWVESPAGEYPAHATTWLNDARWEQWQEPAARTRDGPADRSWEHLDPNDASGWIDDA